MSESESTNDWSDLLKTEALVLRSGQSWADLVDDDEEDVDVSDESVHKDKESTTITTEPIENNQKPVDYLEDIDITIPIIQLTSKQNSNEARFDWDNEHNQHQQAHYPSHDSDNWRARDSKGADSDNWRVRDPQGDGPKKPTSFANFSNRDRFEKQEDRLNYRHYEKQEDRSEYRQPEKRRVDPEDAAALEKWNSFHLVVAQEELEKEKEKERLKQRFLESERRKTNKEDDDGTLLSSELGKGDTNQQICINSNESQEKNIDQIQNTDKSKLDLESAENTVASDGTQSKGDKVETDANHDSPSPKKEDMASSSKEQEQVDRVLENDQSSTTTLDLVDTASDKKEETEKEEKDEDQKSLTSEDTSLPQKEIPVTIAQEDSDPVSTENLSTPTEIKDSENEDKKLEEDVTKEDSTVLDEENKIENELSTSENKEEVVNTMEKPEETVSEETKENRDVIDEKENDQEAKDKIVDENNTLVSPVEKSEDETQTTYNTIIGKDDSSDKKEEVISTEKDQIENSTLSNDEEQSSPAKEEGEKIKIDSPTEHGEIAKTDFEAKREESPMSIKEDEEEETKSLSNHDDTEAIDDEKTTHITETKKAIEQEYIKENPPASPKQQEEVLKAQAVESDQSKSSTKTDLPQEKEELESQQDQKSKEKRQSSCVLESEDVEEKEKEEKEEKKEKEEVEEKKETDKEPTIDENEITKDEIDGSTKEQTDKAKESQPEELINNNVKADDSLEEIKKESSILEKEDTQETTLSSDPEENKLSRNIEKEKQDEEEVRENEKKDDTQNIQFIDNQNQTNNALNEKESENSTSVTDPIKESLDSNETNEIDSSWNKELVKELNQAEPTGWGDKPVTEETNSSTEPKKEETGWHNAAGWTQESNKEVNADKSEGLANERSQWGKPNSWNSPTNQLNDQPQLNNSASWNQKKQQDKPNWGQDQNLNNTISTSNYGRRGSNNSSSSNWGTINQAKSPKVASKKPSPGSWRSQIKSPPKNDNAGGWKQFATNEAAINTVKETRVESPKPKKAFLPKNMQSAPKLDKSWTSDTTSWSKTSDMTTHTTASSVSSQSDTHQADSSWSKISKSPSISQANPSWSTIQESHSKPSTLTNENASWSQTQNNWSKSQAWSATTQAQSPLKPHEATTTTQPTQQQHQQQQVSNGAAPVFNISLSDFDSVVLEHNKEEVETKKMVPNAPIEINLNWNDGEIVMHPSTENINIMQAPLTVVLDDNLQELQVTPKIEHATLPPPVQQMHSTTTTTTTTSENTDFWSQHSQNNEWNMTYHDTHPEPSSSTESGGHKSRPRIQMDGSQWKLMNKFLKNK